MLIFILLIFIISSYILYLLLKSKDNFTIDPNIKLVDKIIDLMPISESSYRISKSGDLLYSLKNLPPNEFFDLTFNDLSLSLKSDQNGIYTFIEPLPVSLLQYYDIRITLNQKSNNPQGYYKNYVNPNDINNIYTRIKLTNIKNSEEIVKTIIINNRQLNIS